MSDDIQQTLSLDASQSIDALRQLQAGFQGLQGTLGGMSSTFSTFNAGAGKTVSALVQIAGRANEAAAALNKLNSLKPPPIASGSGSSAAPQGGGNPAASLLSGQQAAAAMNQLLGQTTQQAGAAAGAVSNLGSGAQNALNGATRAGSGFAVSLETITRVISTQLIVRSLNAIRSAVEDSFQGFVEFNKAAAEIQTILDAPLAHIRDEIHSLSNEFNAPLLDVAKGKYEALSNGFITASDSSQVLVASLKFAKVGIASVSESVDLISTSLNAYGNSADHAETISAKLFKTIELGRVVGSELANSFGRVAPVAKEIGASEDEILAAFSSITIGGVKASEAATQIRATLSSLLKPSSDAEAAFRKLGVTSGEQLIQAKGFQGALQALIGTTDGSASAIAKLFPNVRALNGVLRETGGGTDIFKDHLEQISKASADLLNKKFEVRIDSNAEQVATAVNKLKNLFTVDLGEALVNTAAQALVFVGGVDSVIAAMKALAVPVFAVVGALAAYGVGAGIAALRSDLFAASSAKTATAMTVLRTALGGLVAAITAYELGAFIGDRITAAIEGPGQKLREQSQQALDLKKSQIDAEDNLNKQAANQNLQVIQNAISKVRAQYFSQVDAAKEANAQLISEDQATMDKLIAAHERFAADSRRAAQQAQNDIVSSEKSANDQRGALVDQQFNFQSKRYSDLQNVARNRQSATDLGNVGSKLAKGADTSTDKAAVDAAFQRAEAFARQAVSSAETTKNIAAQYQAEQTLESILQQRIGAEEAFQKNRQNDANTLNKKAADEEARVTKLKSSAKTFLENSNAFDDKGELLPDDKIKANFEKAKAALADFKKTAFSGNNFNLEDLFGFDKLQARLDQSVTKGEVKQLLAAPSALDKLYEQIQGSLDTHSFIISTAPHPEKLKGLPKDQQIEGASQQFSAAGDELNLQQSGATARAKAEATVKTAVDNANRSYTEQKGIVESLANAAQLSLSPQSFDKLEGDRQTLAKLRQEVQSLITQPEIAAESVNKLADAFTKLQATATTALGTDIRRAANEYGDLVKAFEAQQSVKGQSSAGVNQANLGAAQAQLEANANRIKVQALLQAADASQKEQATTAATATATQRIATGIESGVTNAQQLEAAMQAVAAQAEKAAAASQQIGAGGGGGGAIEEAKALGGLIGHFASGGMAKYFASGGANKGTDTIPAMLSPGETVIDARNSKKFFSQIQAIRAGGSPAYKSTGGSVTNINVGDINVNGAKQPQSTAREVMNEIRRERRRGTGTLG